MRNRLSSLFLLSLLTLSLGCSNSRKNGNKLLLTIPDINPPAPTEASKPGPDSGLDKDTVSLLEALDIRVPEAAEAKKPEPVKPRPVREEIGEPEEVVIVSSGGLDNPVSRASKPATPAEEGRRGWFGFGKKKTPEAENTPSPAEVATPAKPEPSVATNEIVKPGTNPVAAEPPKTVPVPVPKPEPTIDDKGAKPIPTETPSAKPENKRGWFGLGRNTTKPSKATVPETAEAGTPVSINPVVPPEAKPAELDTPKEVVTKVEPPAEGTPEDEAEPKRDAPPPSPQIRAGLIINVQVSVLGKPEFNEVSRRINSIGEVSLPLLGNVKLVEMTLEEASILIKKKYGEFIRNPDVQLSFVYDESDSGTSPWGYISVLGRVRQPGRINLPPSQVMTLSEAIRLAGGFDTSAKTKEIKIRRAKKEGGVEEISFDMRSIGKAGHARDLTLYPRDTVYVPETWF